MNKVLKNKKGQFYILTALVLIAFALLTVSSSKIIIPESQNFKEVYENYIFESNMVLNNALYEETSVFTEYEKFIDSFISYVKIKRLNLEIFAIVENGNNIYFTNNMIKEVHILNLNITVEAGDYIIIDRSGVSEVVLEVKDDVFFENIYKFTISNQGTDTKAVLKVKKGNNREIFVQE